MAKHAAMPRIPRCDVTDEGCDDPRCKVGACILAAEERQAAKAAAVAHRDKVRDAAIEVIDTVFRATHHRAATPAELGEWLAKPEVQEEAERRVQWRKRLSRSGLGLLGL